MNTTHEEKLALNRYLFPNRNVVTYSNKKEKVVNTTLPFLLYWSIMFYISENWYYNIHCNKNYCRYYH